MATHGDFTVTLAVLTSELTPQQLRIVEWGEGPAVVIAGAGTGKTRVIVERVRHLLETRAGLLPENLLVLTYNVKAAAELQERLDASVGVAARSRMSVSNFHSFCQRILTEHAADAGLPPRPDVLDGVGQVLLLKDIRPQLGLVYHGGHDAVAGSRRRSVEGGRVLALLTYNRSVKRTRTGEFGRDRV